MGAPLKEENDEDDAHLEKKKNGHARFLWIPMTVEKNGRTLFPFFFLNLIFFVVLAVLIPNGSSLMLCSYSTRSTIPYLRPSLLSHRPTFPPKFVETHAADAATTNVNKID